MPDQPPSSLIALEIGGTKLQMFVGNPAGEIRERRRFTVAKEAGGEGIRAQLRTALPGLAREFSAAAIGVGFGGPVDWRTGIIRCSHQIQGWADFPLGQWLGELTGLPVRVDNDANVGALGEARSGAGRGCNPVFYVTLGSGVGGGLVVDGAIYHGATPGEAEIGHVRLDRRGTIVEARCSGWSVDARIRKLRISHPESLLSQLAAESEGSEARHLSAALAVRDPIALSLLDDVAEDLAFGLSHVAHLMHPEVVVLGGGLALVGEPLREAVAKHLTRFLMEAFRPGPAVRLAGLREDAVPSGALALAAKATNQ